MILKVKTDAGWTYLDSVERFDRHGILTEPLPPIDGDPQGERTATFTFTDMVDLHRAVVRGWGDVRSFDREIWPQLDGGRAVMIDVGVAFLEGDRKVLVLWADEAFLLSDDGKTIDRLR